MSGKQIKVKQKSNSVTINGLNFSADRNTLHRFKENKKDTVKSMLIKFKDLKFKMLETKFQGEDGNVTVEAKFSDDGGYNMDFTNVDCESTLSQLPENVQAVFRQELEKVVKAFSEISVKRNKQQLKSFADVFKIDLKIFEDATKDLKEGESIDEEQIKEIMSKLAS